jgi:hypothetical protein
MKSVGNEFFVEVNADKGFSEMKIIYPQTRISFFRNTDLRKIRLA